jgi:hypothetical protein
MCSCVTKYALTHDTFWFDRHVPYLASKINFVNEDINAMMISSRLKKNTYQTQSVDKYKTRIHRNLGASTK